MGGVGKKPGQICRREKLNVSDLESGSLAVFRAFIWSNLSTRHIPDKLTARGHHDWPDKRLAEHSANHRLAVLHPRSFHAVRVGSVGASLGRGGELHPPGPLCRGSSCRQSPVCRRRAEQRSQHDLPGTSYTRLKKVLHLGHDAIRKASQGRCRERVSHKPFHKGIRESRKIGRLKRRRKASHPIRSRSGVGPPHSTHSPKCAVRSGIVVSCMPKPQGPGVGTNVESWLGSRK